MHTEDVAKLAEFLKIHTADYAVAEYNSFGEFEGYSEILYEALARGALEWVEERAQERADKIISGDFLPWETGALPVPLPLYLRGTVCPICHKEVSIKLDSETGKYIAVESCDCVKEEPK